MAELKVVIAGAGGRMGQANLRAVQTTEGMVLHAAFDRPGAPAVGRDSGVIAGLEPNGILIGDDPAAALQGAAVVLDFTAPAATVMLLGETARLGLVHVIGTTGLSTADLDAIRAAGAAGARIVQSGNMSLGVNLLAALVQKAAAVLGPDWDVEILEMHHNKKVDAPSGTALLLGEAAARGREVSLGEKAVRVRDGHTGPRQAGTIGFATLRGGTVVGEHSVIFAGSQERIELSHHAEDRALFAHGAVRAALWAAGQPPGFYSMMDVLGLNT